MRNRVACNHHFDDLILRGFRLWVLRIPCATQLRCESAIVSGRIGLAIETVLLPFGLLHAHALADVVGIDKDATSVEIVCYTSYWPMPI